MKMTRKILASLLALVMVLLMLPAAFAEESNVHVLDIGADMEVIAASADNNGKEIVINEYFSVILGEKTRVDDNTKTFADEYVGTKRLNFQQKTKADENGTILPAVKFTTSAAATIKIWWIAGDAGRQFAILDETGAEVTRTNDTLEKNGLCISELTLEAAGTYFLGTPDGSNYLFKLEVTEAAAEVEPPVEIEPTEPETTEPETTVAPTEPEASVPTTTQPVEPGTNPGTGDSGIMIAVGMMMAAACLIVLVQKKRAI